MRVARGGTIALLGVLLLLCIGAGRLGIPADDYGDLPDPVQWHYLAWLLAASAVYLVTVLVVRVRQVPRWSLAFGLAIALAARLIMVATPPVLSTDLYRYVWDGRVQMAGINPYLYKPADPRLAFLRDGQTGPDAIFININRPSTARTIYPPAAQMLFAAIGWAASSIWTVKTVMLLLDLVTGAAAWGLLRASGRPSSWLLIWAWNPLVIQEFAGAGHIDAAAVAASGLALLFAARRWPGWAGGALGIAIACKLLPVALAPAIWRPRGWRAPVAACVVVAAGYAWYAAAGANILGYLPGYAAEEGLDQGGGFLLLRLLAQFVTVPAWVGQLYIAVGLVALAALAWAIVRRPSPSRSDPPRADVIARDALLLSVALLVTLSPHYPWYLTLAVLPATVVPRVFALWPSIAGPLLYRDSGGLGEPWWAAVVYLPALIWLIFELSRGTSDA